MIDTIYAVILTLGSGMAGGFSGWFFTRKRQNIENIDLALTTWQKVVDSLERRVDSLLLKVDSLTDENTKLKEEISQLRDELLLINKKDRKIEQLEKKVQKYEKLLTDNGIEF